MIIKRDDAFMAVCELRTPVSPTQFSIGTGMFVSSSAGNEKFFGWIVTANHVAVDTNDTTEIVIATSDGKATSLPLKMFGSLSNWRHHPVADISVFQIYFSPTNEKFMRNRFFPFDHFNLDKQARDKLERVNGKKYDNVYIKNIIKATYKGETIYEKEGK